MKNLIFKKITRFLVIGSFCVSGFGVANAQVFNPTSTSETIFPSTSINPIILNYSTPPSGYTVPSYAIPGLYNNAHMSTVQGIPGDPVGTDAQIAEVASWTEDDKNNWENGFFTYGYSDNAGNYTATGIESIPGAKYLHAAYMTDGLKGYVVVSYVSRQQTYNWQIVSYDITTTPWTPIYGWVMTTPWMYNFEYRVYDWNVPTSTVTLRKRGFITGATPTAYTATPTPGIPIPHPKLIPTGPLSPGYDGVYPHEGTLVMDVSKDATRVAFAYTCNGNWVQSKVGVLVGSNPPNLNLSLERTLAEGTAKNPLDIAFRHDPTNYPATGPKDFVHTLFEDGAGGYVVTQQDYDYVVNPGGLGTFADLVDDAITSSGPTYTGTPLISSLADHIKLDVPDESIERKWAYTWSDGGNIYLRRYSTPSSTDPSSVAGSSVNNIVNDGSLQDLLSNRIYNINGGGNDYPTVAYKTDAGGINKNILVGWSSRATLGSSGAVNFESVELLENPVWSSPPTVASTMDYLDIQSTNTSDARKSLAFSHHSITTADLLYTCFVQDDGADMLHHKNHVMSTSSYWRQTLETAVAKGSDNLNVGPNPFSNKVKLMGTIEGNCSVELVDFIGRSIMKAEGDLNKINAVLEKTAPSLLTGNYLLRVNKDKGDAQTFKLTKQ